MQNEREASPGRVREWRLHVGAHKTATTHLQTRLEAARAALAEQGVDCLPMEEVRTLHLPPPAGRGEWRLRLRQPMRRRLEAAVAPLRLGPDRLVISEENLIGWPIELLGRPFYPRAERLLRPFATLSHGARMEVFLSVRSFEGLLASAYAQELRLQLRRMPDGFGPVRAAALHRPPSWTELVGRLRATLPRARLRVWTIEDYRREERTILSTLCGVEFPESAPLPPPARTRSPSAEAIAALEAIPQGPDRATRRAEAARIIEGHARGEPFAPFAPAESRLLAEAYEEDLDRLERAWPGVLMRGAGDAGAERPARRMESIK